MGRGRAQEPKSPPHPVQKPDQNIPVLTPGPSLTRVPLLKSADCKRGQRKGAASKNVNNRQKVSNSFATLFDNFLRRAKNVKIRQKSIKKVFDTFWQFSRGTIFLAPFGGLWSKAPQKKTLKGRSPVPLQLHPCNFRLHPSNLRLHPRNFQLHPDYTYTFWFFRN